MKCLVRQLEKSQSLCYHYLSCSTFVLLWCWESKEIAILLKVLFFTWNSGACWNNICQSQSKSKVLNKVQYSVMDLLPKQLGKRDLIIVSEVGIRMWVLLFPQVAHVLNVLAKKHSLKWDGESSYDPFSIDVNICATVNLCAPLNTEFAGLMLHSSVCMCSLGHCHEYVY